MEEEDRNSKLEADIEELRQQLKLAQRESYNRKADLKRQRTFLGDELQKVRQKAVVTEQEKEAYESKLKKLQNEIKDLQEAAKSRSSDLPSREGETEVSQDGGSKEAELAALHSQLDAVRRVWVVQDEQWSPGTLVDVTSDNSAVVMTQDGNVAEHAIADLIPADLQLNASCVSNMADLGQEGLKPPVLVETLLDNKSKDALFTFVGSVLLYLHDSEVMVPQGPEVRAAYRCCNHTGELSPHVFSVLETAYRSMRLEQQSQSVILTGAAGAGKSRLFRSSLEYLVLDRHKHVHKLLDGLTVLEAFGCAQTVTNKFSSRVSTLVEIQYDIAGTALGASVAAYGLEKMRITEQKDFNFAVFYQMCAGATEGEKKTLHLMSAAEFPYLNSHLNGAENRRISNSVGVNYDSAGDVERYRHLKTAMSNMGLDSVMRAAIFRILAAILWLGKIEFYEDKDGIKDRTVVDKAAHLLRCTASDLEQVLRCTAPKEMNHFDGLSEVQAQIKSATCARDMLAQALYTRVFNWIIESINALLSKDDAFSVVGVLDLVSFEMVEEDNTFDQFYRNYTTECVENLFNRDFFEVEQDEYEAENLKLPESFEFPTSRGCIDLIDRQDGFISLLDQECQFVKGSEPALTRRLNSTFEQDPCFSRGRSKRGFNVGHWHSEVHYVTTDMIEKNQDILPPSVVSLMDQCKCKFLAKLFPSADIPQSSRPVTLLTQLKNQMAALLRPLSSPSNGTTPYFVRCLCQTRPGVTNGEPDSGYLSNQLKAYRVPQMLQLRYLGFPVRSSFVDFYNRYRIFSETQLVDRADSMYKQQCEFILASMNFDRGDFQTGVTKVYLKESQLKLLEQKRHDLREKAALRVQKQFRTMRSLVRFRDWRETTAEIKPYLRGILARSKMKQLLEASFMADARKHSDTYNKYVREQLEQAKVQANAMQEADKESKEWNIAWEQERLENAQNLAREVFEKAHRLGAQMELDEMLGFRDPSYSLRQLLDESEIHSKEIQDRVHEFRRKGTKEAVKERQRQLEEKEDERKARQALVREEQHLRNVSAALAHRSKIHPLQELSYMRSEEAYQRAQKDILETEVKWKKIEMDSQKSLNLDDPNAPGEDSGPGTDLLEMLRNSSNGLLGDEMAKIQADPDYKPTFEDPPDPVQPDDNVEMPSDDDEDDDEYEPSVDETGPESTGAEAASAEEPEDVEAAAEETAAEQDVLTTDKLATDQVLALPPDFVPPLSSFKNDDEDLTVEEIIRRKREKRQNQEIDMDNIFSDIDNELAKIKHMYFEPNDSATKYEFVGKEEEPKLDCKYRFKYKFRGVDAGLTDKDLQSLV